MNSVLTVSSINILPSIELVRAENVNDNKSGILPVFSQIHPSKNVEQALDVSRSDCEKDDATGQFNEENFHLINKEEDFFDKSDGNLGISESNKNMPKHLYYGSTPDCGEFVNFENENIPKQIMISGDGSTINTSTFDDLVTEHSETENSIDRLFGNLYRARSKSMEFLQGSGLSESSWTVYEDKHKALSRLHLNPVKKQNSYVHESGFNRGSIDEHEIDDDLQMVTNGKDNTESNKTTNIRRPSVDQQESLNPRTIKLRTCSVELEQLVSTNQQTSSYRARRSNLLGRYSRSSLSVAVQPFAINIDPVKTEEAFIGNDSAELHPIEVETFGSLSRPRSKSMEFLRGSSMSDFSLSLYNDAMDIRSGKRSTMEVKPYRHLMTYSSRPNDAADDPVQKLSNRQVLVEHPRKFVINLLLT